MSLLFSPLTLRGITLRNRIAVSPMCMYSSQDGFATDWHLVHLGSRAVGGAGLIIAEATAVVPEGRITPHDLGLWNDAHIEGLQRITKFITEQGAVPGVQLAHAGRKASHHRPWDGGGAISPQEENGWQTVAPSAVPFDEGEPTPTALSEEGIQQVIAAFEASAKRALEAGFKVIEIHAAHGYLLHEFYSPLSNQRTDKYGGSFENRIRLTLEVTERLRKVWPEELPIIVRISATDWTEGGWTGDDSVALAKELKKLGVDLVDCSTGGNVPRASIPVGPGYQVPFAEQVKKEADVLTGAVGMITDTQQAEEILASGQADIVLLAREMLRDPYFALHVAHELGAEQAWPPQYERAKPRK
ncbi:NADPH dehydrogenase NamA [Pontibacter akesuensis]|uniref:2,4-dienoyl-CoA reductase n=1 Tax=Pontibacter akesuensis TaxID=388950 RepID=A0A1I7GSU3_9BACT|nr:NADPH dehydrogenase NamA [Pontibacter akesuensis]GHA55254.1 oxidoreductase [Pontibacter akesuensis]SFU51507.1 2,4-dienoyl-CoA reductase [Pontibacter akesuensis]